MNGRRITVALSPRTVLLAVAVIARGWAFVSVRGVLMIVFPRAVRDARSRCPPRSLKQIEGLLVRPRPSAQARMLAEQERTAHYDRETAANARATAEETP